MNFHCLRFSQGCQKGENFPRLRMRHPKQHFLIPPVLNLISDGKSSLRSSSKRQAMWHRASSFRRFASSFSVENVSKLCPSTIVNKFTRIISEIWLSQQSTTFKSCSLSTLSYFTILKHWNRRGQLLKMILKRSRTTCKKIFDTKCLIGWTRTGSLCCSNI